MSTGSNVIVLPAWEVISSEYVTSGVPVRIPVGGAGAGELFVTERAEKIGVSFRLDKGEVVPASPLREISVREIVHNGERRIEIATETYKLYREFYSFLETIFASIIHDGKLPIQAFQVRMNDWRALLQSVQLLSDERRLGLMGELWMLQRLIAICGPGPAMDAWTGPDRQPHDFRVGKLEFEVKATSNERRLHRIHGLGQLQASDQCCLYLVSLHLAPGGTGGRSLPECVDELIEQFSAHANLCDRLLSTVHGLGYYSEDRLHYPLRWRMRSAPRLVEIGAGTPHLTRNALAALPAEFASHCITAADYTIDLDGLGVEDGSPEFLHVLPLRAEETRI